MMNKEKVEQTPRDLSLYIHIPFCKSKCIYCDFLSFGACRYEEQAQYVKALCKEIGSYTDIAKDYKIRTIFIGGGTPSYINDNFIEDIMDAVKQTFVVDEDAEITIEGNPDSLTRDKLRTYHAIGINRLSIGLQSANDAMLTTLNRVHNYDQFIAAYQSARQEGFTNINVDLMSGLPGETADSYIRTLAKVAELNPEHISAYSLIVEEGTPLEQRDDLLDLLPSEEEDRKLYAKTKMFLKNSGYERYEISNYAKHGYACRHNLVYWTGGEYLGVGLGASSYLTIYMEDQSVEKIRFHGTENMEEYIARFLQSDGMQGDEYTTMFHAYEYEDENVYGFDDAYGMYMDMNTDAADANLQKYRAYEDNPLLEFVRDYYKDLHFQKRRDEMEECMFLGLRCMNGVSKQMFHDRFGVEMESIYAKAIEKHKKQGLLAEEEGRIFLTDKGIDVSNLVMADFML